MSVDVRAEQRSRTFTWDDPAETAAAGLQLTGLEYLSGIATGAFPAPPIARLLDFSVLEVEHGRAVFAMEPAEWMFNPLGSVHGGIAATILDSCMGCAVHTTLEAGVGFTTGDLQVRYIRARGAVGATWLAREGSRSSRASARCPSSSC